MTTTIPKAVQFHIETKKAQQVIREEQNAAARDIPDWLNPEITRRCSRAAAAGKFSFFYPSIPDSRLELVLEERGFDVRYTCRCRGCSLWTGYVIAWQNSADNFCAENHASTRI